MTIRNSGSRRTTFKFAPSQLRDRMQKRKRKQDRRTLLEALENRQMLAGPQLTGIQPNEGELLFDGSTLTVAPRELVFRFDDTTSIDPSTLDGIRITRAGADGVFESATATTDFGTGGSAIVEFRSLLPGASGNGQLIRLSSVSRAGTRLPIVSLVNGVVQIEMNSNPFATTRIQDLTQALAASSQVNGLVQAVVVSGSNLTPIGGSIGGSRTLTLQGANAAQAVTDLGLADGTLVRFIAAEPGADGRGVTVAIARRNFGGPANPVVTVQGKTIQVQVNTTPGFATTVNGLLSSINGNPDASALVTAVLESGPGTTSLASLASNFAPLVLSGAGDEVLTPGYVGLGDSEREIVFRFAENLPDDTYRIDILGAGAQALANVAGEAFNDGIDLGIQFELNLGPQVVAVVPEPVRRVNGQRSPAIGIVEVHFNNDDLLDTASAAENPDYYQLIFTASNGTEVVVKPGDFQLPTGVKPVDYSPLTNIATLNFGRSLSRFPDPTSANGEFLKGEFRLKIGTDESLPSAPIRVTPANEAGDSFNSAVDLSGSLGSLVGGTRSLIVDGTISNTNLFPFELPGGQDMAGRRTLRPDDPSRLIGPVPLDYYRLDANGDLVGDADSQPGITTFLYNFQSSYAGPDPATGGQRTYFNVITEQQKERIREAMMMFSEYLGIQFVESANLGTTIVVGDLFSANGDAISAQGGNVVSIRPDALDPLVPELGVLDFQDFDESDDDNFGDEFSRGAFLLVGQLIGYGYADNLPQPVTQSTTFVLNPGNDSEATFPSIVDILHGQYLYRPESSDIDLYRFQLDGAAKVSIETFAERADQVSLLDTNLRLYRLTPSGNFEEIAANDDYSSNDSLIELDLAAGTYMVGVSASGNSEYDPTISGTGFGGRSEGSYQLRLTAKPAAPQGLVDTTGVALDGDADGKPGGVFNFWYKPAEPLNPNLRQLEQTTPGSTVTPATIYVDKAATGPTANGSLQAPFQNIDDAIAVALPGDVVRVLANGGADGMISTASDNLSYQVGVNTLGQELADGRSIQIPGGVTMVVDAGAIIKFRNSFVSVGSNSPTINRAGGALMTLGTPVIVESNGQIAANVLQEPIPGSVILTSYNDTSVGTGNPPTTGLARPGDWGGIDFRGDIDSADEGRVNLEANGVFLNQIYGADIRYGGGQVSIAGQNQALAPISIDVTRPTIAYSRIANNASAAVSATPDSFIESTFMDYVGLGEVGSVSDFSRVGPDIHNNTILNNSINGLFIRVTTRTGEGLKALTGQARFDDTDIVHVLSENLVIKGTPGGPVVEDLTPPALLIETTAVAGGTLAAGDYVYRIAYVDANGNSSPASDLTSPVTVGAGTGSVRLNQLPVVPTGTSFIARRLYRATVDANGVVGQFRLAGNLNGNSTTFTDNGSLTGAVLVQPALQLRSRQDARLAIDPGVVMKMDGARIETSFGGQLYAEASSGLPIVMTSLNDSRFGAAGTFSTANPSDVEEFAAGDWAGIYVGYAGTASLDNVRIAGAGGVSRIAGEFASFNPIEVHQGDFRLTNSRLEMNADGRGLAAGNRAGLGDNESGTLFIRGAAPTIVGNTFIDGSGPALTIDVNSMGYAGNSDGGRSTGGLDAFDFRGNSGPLIRGNQLANNDLNGLQVRGGEVTTEVVFDDTDIVHIVLDTITIPNQHIFGGMRLESTPDASLVVKFESRGAEPAGIIVGGSLLTAADQLVDIADRVGGSLQLVGFPDFPVVLTTLGDDSVGAGFTPDGQPQVDTNDDGLFGAGQPTVNGFAQLPFGTEVNNGLNIDNDVSVNVPGFFRATPGAGGQIQFNSGVTIDGTAGIEIDQDYIFDFLNFVDVGSNGNALSLANTTITQQPTLIANDRVQSRGTFNGQNGAVNWTVDTYFENGVPVLFNKITFDSSTSLGNLRFINYLDEDVEFVSDDVLFTRGTPGQDDFRAFTVDGGKRIGFSQGGYYTPGNNLENATYVGWTADIFADLLNIIQANNGTQYTIPGNIDLADLPPRIDSQLGAINGPGDVTTAFAWDVDPNAFTASITTFLEVIPRDPSAPSPLVQSGLWDGVTIREGASDRNVVGGPENEPTNLAGAGANGVPGSAQFLGELAAESRGGDENQRLGFVVDGEIATRSDLDVYSFVGRAGSEVWFDIDRTQMSFDSVVELIDANGFVLASSDNSAQESVNGAVSFISAALDPDAASPMNKTPLASQTLSAGQDDYSTNPRDAGLRVTLPGESGTRNLYHVRVRSSNGQAGDVTPDGPNSPLVSAGLTKGSYRLQVRLREADEFPGTQVRFGDLRYAQTNLEIIGQPFHSPLIGDAQEAAANNDVRGNAQPIGPYALATDANNPNAANILASDRLSLTVGGSIDSANDVDWYQFSINSQGLPAGAALNYLSTVFDLDYADGYARADMSLWVFDSNGALILAGLDSNIADDQPRANQAADSADLSRGSAGTNDPYIGMTELAEGTYFVAISNHTQAPAVLNQYYASANNPNVVSNPLLRLEPVTSVRRIVEDHIDVANGGSQTANFPGSANGPQILFNNQTIVPLTLNDLVVYSLNRTGNGTQSSFNMANPFSGLGYGTVGFINPDLRDFAVTPNGEFFGYATNSFSDLGWEYVRISSETGAITSLGPTALQTFQEDFDQNGAVVVNRSDTGLRVEALTFRDSDFGFFVANRSDPSPTNQVLGPDYTQNILYIFDAATGEPLSGPLGDRAPFTVGGVTIDPRANGAGTQVRERGFIDTSASGPSTTINVGPATTVNSAGVATFTLRDGTAFAFRDANNTLFRFEFNSGPDFRMRYDAEAGISIQDGDRFSLNGVVYEFETGGAINVSSGASMTEGATLRLTSASNGASLTFEMDSNGSIGANNIPVSFTSAMSAGEVADALAAAINGSNLGINADSLGVTGRISLTGESTASPPLASGGGLSFVGGAGISAAATVPVRVEENATFEQFVDAIRASVQAPVSVGVAGDRVNFLGAVSGNDFSQLINRGIIVSNPGNPTGAFGDGAVSPGSTAIGFLASDSAETIAARISAAVNQAAIGTITTSASGRSVTFTDAILNRNEVESVGSPIRLTGVAPGGSITGITMIGNQLFAVSDAGGLYVVNNPNINTAVQGAIGGYVASATDLLGIQFTGLSTGPNLNYVDTWSTPGISTTRSMSNLLFGTGVGGRIYAFNTAGVLQPVFEGGATSIATGRGGATAIEMSTLDYNLWHVTARRNGDAGHGVPADPFGTRAASSGGSSLYFGYGNAEGGYQPASASGNNYNFADSPINRARQDGQPVDNTYNFPGGAQGAIESMTFSLEGYAAQDLPYLYFNYFLATDGFDANNPGPLGAPGGGDPIDDDNNADRDALNVFVITPDGQSTLVASNNEAISVPDGILFDNTGSWRQARVPLGAFAGQNDLRLRIEFSTAGQMTNGSAQLRTVAGDRLMDGQTFSVGNQVFELDFGPIVTLPGGSRIAEVYAAADGGVPGSDPSARVTVVVDGLTFVLSDGQRTINPGEVEVILAIADDPTTTTIDESKTIDQLTAEEVAGLLAASIAVNRPVPTTVDSAFNFSIESNDEIARATRLPRVAGDTIISGSGRLGSADGTSNLNDVDMSRISLSAGETVTVSVTRTSGLFQPRVRIFDVTGRELVNNVGNGGAVVSTFTATEDGEYYIGINGGGGYNPSIAGSGQVGFGGLYNAVVETRGAFQAVQVNNRVQVIGVSSAITNDPTIVNISGQLGITSGNIRVPVRIDMTADEIAFAVQDALSQAFSSGVLGAFPTRGGVIEIGGLNVTNAGPFAVLGGMPSDAFGALGPGRAVNNANEGVYLDDFVIGFAERGELVTGAVPNDTFSNNLSPAGSVTGVPVTGSYQLEIRDASEYAVSGGTFFRTIDTNDRMVDGAVTLVAPASNQIIDGTTFSISDGERTLIFEFDQVGSTGGVAAGHVSVPFDASTTSLNSAGLVARAVVDAINQPSVQSLLDVLALLSTGVDTAIPVSTINLFGSAIVSDPAGLFQVTTSTGRGDSNRERDDQGVILIENSKFSYAAEFGIDINHGATTTIDGQTVDNLVRYPRNLVEVNTDGLVPGVVVQSNTIAYSRQGGIRIQGLSDTGSVINPVPFDRIVNNTIVGGTITEGTTTPAEVFEGLLFPAGSISFADAVVSYNPTAGGGPAPDTLYQDPTQALGPPDSLAVGFEGENGDNCFTSLGYGGSLTLQFTDNVLTGDGTPAPDLVVFEIGDIESVGVEVSRDGIVWTYVGIAGGLTNRIDIDEFGFTPQDRLAFVRLTDMRQGDRNSLTTGADIDAVGALSSVPADSYDPSGTGVTVVNGAAPTLINNVIANSDVGIQVDASSARTVSGGNAFFRNTTNLNGAAAFGQFSQVIPPATDIFVSPTELVFDPASGSPLIDSAISSLVDRPSLVTVKGPLGLEQSPILAPRVDVNGQLRIDDPLVDSPSGLGENVFADRGAADRADQAGPIGRIVLPADNDAAGFDLNPATNVVTFTGSPSQAFEIQLIDGIAPNDSVPGVGIADGSVTSASVLVFRDNEPLVEGVDYRFGYQPSTNTIRLTPLAGVWQDDATYTIRLLDAGDSVVVASNGDQYQDGDILNIVTSSGLSTLEVETGISIEVPVATDGSPIITDGESFSIFDGVREVIFETDTNSSAISGRTIITLRSNMTLSDVTAAYVTAINSAGLGLTATASDGNRIQLTGSNVLSSVDPLTSTITTYGAIGVSIGYGLQIPVDGNTPDGITSGQTFEIRRGPFQITRFELTASGVVTNPGYIPVNIGSATTLDQIANALVAAIGGAGIGLDPSNEGFGRVALNGDSTYSIELTNTVLQTLGVPGQQGSVALPISIAPSQTGATIAQQIDAAINGLNLPGVTTQVVGPRVILNGTIGISGTGALSVVTIRDRVGNLLQSNQADGSTQFTIILGNGFDYGDAPEPKYTSSQANGGPRHELSDNLRLGVTVTPESDAVANNGDLDDGVNVRGVIYAGFEDANFDVKVSPDNGPFVVDYWVDWNNNGVFESSEKGARFTSNSAAALVSFSLLIEAPSTAVVGQTFARFRLTRDGIDSPVGDAPNGEVEDILIQVQGNPFQNQGVAGRWDVNASGDVSPIDALQVINSINRAGGPFFLDSTNPPSSAPYLDVNGDGIVSSIDANAVITRLTQLFGFNGSGEGEGEGGSSRSTYLVAGNGVMGSAATMLSSPFTTSLGGEGEYVDGPVASGPNQQSAQRKSGSGSIFQPAAALALDDYLDSLASDRHTEDNQDSEDPNSAIDAVFGLFGS